MRFSIPTHRVITRVITRVISRLMWADGVSLPNTVPSKRSVFKRSVLSGRANGFTLIELLVVVFIIAMASALAVMSLRPSSNQQALQNAQQLAALLDSTRANARAQKTSLLWVCGTTGITVQEAVPSSNPSQHFNWQAGNSFCDPSQGVIGPEPITKAQGINVYSSEPGGKASSDVNTAVHIGTDGLGPFKLDGQ